MGDLLRDVRVAADEYIWEAAGTLTLGELVSLLGRRADALTELWNEWGLVRPLLLAARVAPIGRHATMQPAALPRPGLHRAVRRRRQERRRPRGFGADLLGEGGSGLGGALGPSSSSSSMTTSRNASPATAPIGSPTSVAHSRIRCSSFFGSLIWLACARRASILRSERRGHVDADVRIVRPEEVEPPDDVRGQAGLREPRETPSGCGPPDRRHRPRPCRRRGGPHGSRRRRGRTRPPDRWRGPRPVGTSGSRERGAPGERGRCRGRRPADAGTSALRTRRRRRRPAAPLRAGPRAPSGRDPDPRHPRRRSCSRRASRPSPRRSSATPSPQVRSPRRPGGRR